MLDLARLRALLAVHDHGALDSAARALSLPPSTLANQVAGLEQQLGVPLIEGDPAAGRLTSAGRRLAAESAAVLGRLEAVESGFRAPGGRLGGLLRIGVVAGAGRVVLPDALSRLRHVAPDVDVRVEQLDPSESLPGLLRGTVDIAVVAEDQVAPLRLERELDRRELFTEPMLVAAPGGHPVRGPAVRLQELREARWIAVGRPALAEETLSRACALAGFAPTVVGHCTDAAVALALVGAGQGIALVSATEADRHLAGLAGAAAEPPGVRLLPVAEPELRRRVVAVVRSGSRDPAVARLLDALTAAAGRLRTMLDGTQPPDGADPAALLEPEPQRPTGGSPTTGRRAAPRQPASSGLNGTGSAGSGPNGTGPNGTGPNGTGADGHDHNGRAVGGRDRGRDVLGRWPGGPAQPGLAGADAEPDGRPGGAGLAPAAGPEPASPAGRNGNPSRSRRPDPPFLPPPMSDDLLARRGPRPVDPLDPAWPPGGHRSVPPAVGTGARPEPGLGRPPREPMGMPAGGEPPRRPTTASASGPDQGADPTARAGRPGSAAGGTPSATLGPDLVADLLAADFGRPSTGNRQHPPSEPGPGSPTDHHDGPDASPPDRAGRPGHRESGSMPATRAELPRRPAGPDGRPDPVPTPAPFRTPAPDFGRPATGGPAGGRAGPGNASSGLFGRNALAPDDHRGGNGVGPYAAAGPGRPGSAATAGRPALTGPALNGPAAGGPSGTGSAPIRASSTGSSWTGSSPTGRPQPEPSSRRPDLAGRARDFGPMGTLPPAAGDVDVRLSIFEQLQSEWFSRRRSTARHSTNGEPIVDSSPPWSSPADEGWRAAARLAEPTTAGTTEAGLPKRVPQALIVPGGIATADPPPSTPVSRSPREMRGRLSSYRDGVRRGRHSDYAEHPRPDEEPT